MLRKNQGYDLSEGARYSGKVSARAAIEIIELIFSSKDWIVRRVDSVSFPDELSIARRVSVDIVTPGVQPKVSLDNGSDVTLLPIAMLSKDVISDFDFWGEKEEERLPKISRKLGREVMKEMLVQWAQKLCSRMSQGEIRDVADRLLQSPISELKGIPDGDLEELLRDGDKWGFDPPDGTKAKAFLVLARMLSRNFILFLPLDDVIGKGERVIVKYSYVRPLALYRSRRNGRWGAVQALAKKLIGLDHLDVILNASNVAYSQSYHFELKTPSNVGITRAELYDDADVRSKLSKAEDSTAASFFRQAKVARKLKNLRPQILAPEERQVESQRATRFGLYPIEGAAYGTHGKVFIRLAAPRRLWLWAVAVTSVLVTVALGIAAFVQSVRNSETDANISLLLVFAAVFLPTLMAPDPNDFSRYILTPTRIAGLISSALPISLALAVIVGWTPFGQPWAYALFGLAVIISLRQVVALIVATPSAETRQLSWLARRRYAFLGKGIFRSTVDRPNWQYEQEFLRLESVRGVIAKEIRTKSGLVRLLGWRCQCDFWKKDADGG